MKFYDQTRRPRRSSTLLVVFLTALIPFALIFSSSAQFQAETIRIINVATEANATMLGAATNQHLSGNGSAATFDVSLANLRAHAVAIGDVNGDGIQDMVIGAPDATFTVGAQTRTGAGIAYVVFGKSTLSGTIDAASQADLTILGGKTGDKLGFSVAVGDVNGDGTSDIVIGSPGADFPGSTTPPAAARVDTGAVFVILGASSLGTPATIDLNTANAANIALFGVNTGDQFGASVAVGNVGGLTSQSPADQAVNDILAGAPGNNGPAGSSRPGGGAAYVQFGGPYLNPVAGATTVRDLSTTPANVIVFGRTGDMLGASVAIGDINGGGSADVVMGAPLADRPPAPNVPAATHTGAVFAIFGGTNLNPAVGTSKTFDISTTQQNVSIYGAGNTNTPGTDDADHLGFSIATGDVTGDSIPDLLIGAPDADASGELKAGAGEAYIVQGGTNLNPTSGSERRLDLFSGDATVTIYGAQAGDHFGSTVAAGNYNIAENTDNTPDFFIGAPGGNNKAGYISIVFGGPTILVFAQRDVALGQDSVRVLGQSAASNDLSGKTLRIRQTLTTTDQANTPFLQQLLVSINGSTVVNDDTQPQFAVGTLTNVTAASTAITGDATAVGDLELAANPSLSLNGTTSFMSVANSASLKPGNGSWSVEFWLKRGGAGTGNFPPVIGSRAWSVSLDKGWAVELDSSNSFKVSAHFADGSTGFDAPNVESANGTALGAWEHWAVVFDRAGGNVQFYRNGALDASRAVTFPTGTIDQTDPILVGADKVTDGLRFLQGTVDDVRVWNSARTATQISDNFKATLLGTETGLAAYWNFNAGNANDLTVNANHGTLNGSASIVFPADRRFLTGNRLTTTSAFPAMTVATASSISWVQTAPAGTSLKIETSLDGGATFQTAVNGGGIPSFGQGDEIGWAIATGDLNNDHGGELIVGAPFANVVTTGGARTQAGVVYVLPSTTSPPPVNVPPTVHVTAPNGAETLQVGQSFDIKWDAFDLNGDATIQKFEVRLSTDGGSNFNFTIAPNLPGSARKFTWTVPIGFNTTQGRVRVIATDNQSATGQDDSDANFTITDAGAIATLVAPNGGENLRFGQQFTISWTVPTAVAATVKGFDLLLSTDSGATFPIQIAPRTDPSQPALGQGIRNFLWNVPSFCTSKARVAVVTTSITNVTTSRTSLADFIIGEPGPTIDAANMFINGDFQLFLLTTAPAGGTEVLFKTGVVVEISTDATGSTFFAFLKAGKIKKNGGKFLSKGTINGQDLGVYFPNGATRFIRITNPVCGITLIKVTRTGDQLVLAAAQDASAMPAQSQPVWQ
jgi:concanavalin A-like lectin/glucanase superfamily protein/FG-GAP repeat protein